jgi:BlaI family transcriptional regulator, penicillinase repressor
VSNIPNISEAEWQIMKIIWKTPEITANRIVEELGDNINWKPNTVKTLINRLMNKGALGYNKQGKEYYYYPLALEAECVKAESESFLDKVFNGSVNSMLINFVKEKKLSKKDIDELRDILNREEE